MFCTWATSLKIGAISAQFGISVVCIVIHTSCPGKFEESVVNLQAVQTLLLHRKDILGILAAYLLSILCVCGIRQGIGNRECTEYRAPSLEVTVIAWVFFHIQHRSQNQQCCVQFAAAKERFYLPDRLTYFLFAIRGSCGLASTNVVTENKKQQP